MDWLKSIGKGLKKAGLKVLNSGDSLLTRSHFKISKINKEIGEFGEMIKLEIDNKNKKISTSIVLKGEDAPIEVRVNEYEFKRHGDSADVTIHQVSSDKQWVEATLNSFVVGKPWPVPHKLVDVLETVLD